MYVRVSMYVCKFMYVCICTRGASRKLYPKCSDSLKPFILYIIKYSGIGPSFVRPWSENFPNTPGVNFSKVQLWVLCFARVLPLIAWTRCPKRTSSEGRVNAADVECGRDAVKLSEPGVVPVEDP